MSAQEIVLSPEEPAELSRRVHSATISQRDGHRARVILLAVQGYSRVEIARLGIRLWLLTGVRTGELRAATPEQFNFDKGI